MKNKTNKIWLLSALLIFLIPLVNFLNPENIFQLSNYDIYLIFFSYFLFLIAIFIFSYIISFKIDFRKIFLMLCFGFYLSFFFIPFQDIVLDLKLFDSQNNFFLSRITSLLLIFSIWVLIIFFIFSKFNFVLVKSILIFSFFIISYTVFINLTFNSNDGFKKTSGVNNALYNIVEDSVFNENINNNIYFVVLDAMMPISIAKEYGIFSNQEINEINSKFKEIGLENIENSVSPYVNSQLSVASMMRLEYPYLRNLREGTWPSMMYQRKNKVTVPELTFKKNNSFFWLGNYISPCLERVGQPWKCIHTAKAQQIMRLSSTIYTDSIIELVLNRIIFKSDKKWGLLMHNYDKTTEGGQRQLKFFKENYKIENKSNKNFYLIHQYSPHTPYSVDSNCNKNNKFINEKTGSFEGYKNSYKCVISEVIDFTIYLSKIDPEAIIVYVGDHGDVLFGDIGTDKIQIKKMTIGDKKDGGMLNTFNAIKAPEICFKEHKVPKFTNNSVIFALNCGFGYNLQYFEP